MDPNATMATELPRAERAAQASAIARSTANWPTRLETTPTPPREHTPQASASSGHSTGDSQRHSGRPRAKLALLTWAGAYAVILLVLAIGGPAMASWPMALRALVVSGLMVAAMTWVIVPMMTRLFRGWLQR
jgi:antibiotic biosynthesis monooxygenase (ABM) superfamily enzyme